MSLPDGLPILMYHKVARPPAGVRLRGHYVDPPAFARQMRLLRALGYTGVTLRELEAGARPRRPIVLTFDDGYANFHRAALPVLERYGFRGVVYLVANQLGGVNAWDVAEGEPEERLMTEAEARDCAARGTEIGSHTLDHVRLAEVPSPEARRQIARSRELLEERLEVPVTGFCYPYGSKSPDTLRMVANAGYRHACSTEKGVNGSKTDPFALRRVNVRRDTILPVFLLKLLRTVKDAS